METILFFLHYALLLLFGILLTAAFANVRFTKKNIWIFSAMLALCGVLQLIVLTAWDERMVWKAYPLVVHLPIIILLWAYYKKRIATVIAAVTTAYLCCQPAKWVGILCRFLTGSESVEYIVRITMLAIVAIIVIRYLSSIISEIYIKDNRSIVVFGIVPIVYYLFDYTTSVYTDLWIQNIRAAVEFVPFVLCISYLIFCIAYHREYERKMHAEQNEHIIRITTEQQAKEIEAIQQKEKEIRILHHDMRHFLHNLSFCLDEEGKDAAKDMINGYISEIETTTIYRYCEKAIINYILSDYASRCSEASIAFSAKVKIEEFTVDELLFSSILSNALENALNAQIELPTAQRQIKLTLHNSENKLLLSVLNPFATAPVFADGLPVSDKKGHGFGTQSIRYMTEKLKGNCQFLVDEKYFVLRIII